MTNPITVDHNVKTGKIVEREMNAEELEQLEADKAKALATHNQEAIKAAQKAALLAKLGLTDDEAKLLLA